MNYHKKMNPKNLPRNFQNKEQKLHKIKISIKNKNNNHNKTKLFKNNYYLKTLIQKFNTVSMILKIQIIKKMK